MSQRSIKSFFTAAPKKKAEEEGEKSDEAKKELPLTPKKPEKSPGNNEKAKKTPKAKGKKSEKVVPAKKPKLEVISTEPEKQTEVIAKAETESEKPCEGDVESEDSSSETKSPVSYTPVKVNDTFDDSPIKRVKSRGKKRTISDSEEETEEESPAKKRKEEKDESPKGDVKKNGRKEKEKKSNGKKDKKETKEDNKVRKEEEVKDKIENSKKKKELTTKEDSASTKSVDAKGEAEIVKTEVKEKKNIAPFFMPKNKQEKEDGPKGDKVDPVNYDPSKSPYNPIKDACWGKGEKVPYLALARTLELVEATSSRLKSIEIVSNFLRSLMVLSPDEVVPALRLCLNQLAPAYTGLELGLGDGALMKAVAQTTGRSVAQIRADVSTLGDLGLVAEASRGKQKTMFQPPPLTLRGVFDRLLEIANMQGGAAMTRKTDKVQSLLVACKYSEARFLIRSLTGKLRVGLAELSLLQALAQAVVLTPPCQDFPPKIVDASKGKLDSVKAKVEEAAMNIKIAYYQCPSYEKVVSELLSGGLDGIVERCPITLGLPVKPMLACPSRGAADVMTKFGSNKFTCEYKYDGERAQIHILADGTVKIFSRNQEDMSGKYPEVVSRAKSWLKPGVTSAIIDSEAVAWDLEKKILLPFQVLSTRKRKDVNEADIKVQVCIFAFDLLVLDGESVVDQSLRIRRGLLKEKLQIVEGQLQFATSCDPETPEEVEEFMEQAVKGHCEGLMVKTLDENATYAIARRSQRWLKLKKDYMEGVGDTLDLVVVGGYLGKGRRTGVYGGFLLACFDPESEEYQTICKIGTGFSDEDLQTHSAKLKEHLLERPPSYYRYDQSSPPDHWFSPLLLWEVKCADLSLSPVHKAAIGLVDSDKGISLRFPRFLRVREDKGPEQATSASQVASMYLNQDQIKGAAAGKEEEEGFY